MQGNVVSLPQASHRSQLAWATKPACVQEGCCDMTGALEIPVSTEFFFFKKGTLVL
jgi:hypothetical protein